MRSRKPPAPRRSRLAWPRRSVARPGGARSTESAALALEERAATRAKSGAKTLSLSRRAVVTDGAEKVVDCAILFAARLGLHLIEYAEEKLTRDLALVGRQLVKDLAHSALAVSERLVDQR